MQEKFGICGLVKKLVDIRSFVRSHGDTNDLVFQDNATKAAKGVFGDPAAVVSFPGVRHVALALLQFHALARRFPESRPAQLQVRLHGPESSSAPWRSHTCLPRLPAVPAAESRPFPRRHGECKEIFLLRRRELPRPACR